MKQNKQTTTQVSDQVEAVAQSQMSQDLKDAVLVVSVVANLFILIGWIALQVTAQYDAQVAHLLFAR